MATQANNLSALLPAEAVTRIGGLSYPRAGSGKVRELFDLGENLLIVATDRISAFDVILEPGIPGKGILLTRISLFWFTLTEDLARNHLLPDQKERLPEILPNEASLGLRAMVVRKLKPLPVECVVRGYLAGSGWEAYLKTGEVCGHVLPEGLREADPLPEPLFTPTTKATEGHDLPITEKACADILGADRFEEVKALSLQLYRRGHDRARRAGMVLADTKFEFGTDAEGKLYLIDEVLTPDSSRYWPLDGYQPGRPQASFDKQYVRDYLSGCGWNRQPPAPVLPPDVVQGTARRYLEAAERLLGVGDS